MTWLLAIAGRCRLFRPASCRRTPRSGRSEVARRPFRPRGHMPGNRFEGWSLAAFEAPLGVSGRCLPGGLWFWQGAQARRKYNTAARWPTSARRTVDSIRSVYHLVWRARTACRAPHSRSLTLAVLLGRPDLLIQRG